MQKLALKSLKSFDLRPFPLIENSAGVDQTVNLDSTSTSGQIVRYAHVTGVLKHLTTASDLKMPFAVLFIPNSGLYLTSEGGAADGSLDEFDSIEQETKSRAYTFRVSYLSAILKNYF